jgi:hypothetical protein
MKINNTLYEWLKWICLIALPAIAWFYGAMADTWGLPYGDQIVTTLNAVGTLIGILIGVSTYNYRKEDSQA